MNIYSVTKKCRLQTGYTHWFSHFNIVDERKVNKLISMCTPLTRKIYQVERTVWYRSVFLSEYGPRAKLSNIARVNHWHLACEDCMNVCGCFYYKSEFNSRFLNDKISKKASIITSTTRMSAPSGPLYSTFRCIESLVYAQTGHEDRNKSSTTYLSLWRLWVWRRNVTTTHDFRPLVPPICAWCSS